MGFLNSIKMALARFMQGRYGADQLGMFTLIAGLVISLLSGIVGLPWLSWIGLALYIVTMYRLLSRNREKRMAENRKYMSLTSDTATRVRQFIRRLKNRKEYRYFRCPNCRVLLRMKRGTGEKEITCARCQHQFRQKA